MKKSILILLSVSFLCLALVGCGKQEQQSAASSNQPVETPTATETPSQPPASDSSANSVSGDTVDLTVLSSTMIYAEVYNMMVSPQDYVGRTVTMRGQFAVYAQTESGPFYFACVIADATACCQQGLEFVLAGDAVYPDDYPEIGSEITVTGEFQTYEEDGYQYCHLIEARMD